MLPMICPVHSTFISVPEELTRKMPKDICSPENLALPLGKLKWPLPLFLPPLCSCSRHWLVPFSAWPRAGHWGYNTEPDSSPGTFSVGDSQNRWLQSSYVEVKRSSKVTCRKHLSEGKGAAVLAWTGWGPGKAPQMRRCWNWDLILEELFISGRQSWLSGLKKQRPTNTVIWHCFGDLVCSF